MLNKTQPANAIDLLDSNCYIIATQLLSSLLKLAIFLGSAGNRPANQYGFFRFSRHLPPDASAFSGAKTDKPDFFPPKVMALGKRTAWTLVVPSPVYRPG